MFNTEKLFAQLQEVVTQLTRIADALSKEKDESNSTRHEMAPSSLEPQSPGPGTLTPGFIDLKAFEEILKKHNWKYGEAVDASVYWAGKRGELKILLIAQQSAEHQQLLQKYQTENNVHTAHI